ncbi:hypothetical protein ACN47A_08825 [Myxococcus fulvus]|uniref:hypothetical protein n=1 Tax=Myxococcus fulvus TaxID=33 RepID=UPI003B99D08B
MIRNEIQVSNIPGIELGMGFDVVQGTVKLSALPLQPDLPLPTGGRTFDLDITLATTRQELEQSLNVSGETNISYGPVSAYAAVDLFKELTFDKYAVWLTIRATAHYSSDFYSNPILREDAKALLLSAPSVFCSQYGHRYVRSITRGGSLYIVAQWITQSQTEQQDLKTQVGASGVLGKFTGDINTTITQKFREAVANTSATVHYSAAGPVPTPSTDVLEVLQSARDFTERLTPENAMNISATLGDYESLVPQALPSPTPSSIGDLLVSRCDQIHQGMNQAATAMADYAEGTAHPERFAATLDYLEQIAGNAVPQLSAYYHSRQQDLEDYLKALETSKVPLDVPLPPDSYPTPLPPLPSRVVSPAYCLINLTRALSVSRNDPDGGVVMLPIDPKDPRQRWIQTGSGTSVRFQNAATKRYLSAPLSPTSPNQLTTVASVDSGPEQSQSQWSTQGGPEQIGYLGLGNAPGWVAEIFTNTTCISHWGDKPTQLFLLAEFNQYAAAHHALRTAARVSAWALANRARAPSTPTKLPLQPPAQRPALQVLGGIGPGARSSL